jgi:hypothetical protein
MELSAIAIIKECSQETSKKQGQPTKKWNKNQILTMLPTHPARRRQ